MKVVVPEYSPVGVKVISPFGCTVMNPPVTAIGEPATNVVPLMRVTVAVPSKLSAPLTSFAPVITLNVTDVFSDVFTTSSAISTTGFTCTAMVSTVVAEPSLVEIVRLVDEAGFVPWLASSAGMNVSEARTALI